MNRRCGLTKTINSGQQCRPNITLHIRRQKHGGGFMILQNPNVGRTVDSLKKFVLERLKRKPFSEKYTLEKKDIRVFLEKNESELEHVEITESLEDNATYVALEYFTVVPTDLLRTVNINQLTPSVRTHPDRNREFTKVSPLYTAAFSEKEQVDPAISLTKTGDKTEDKKKVTVAGISLRCPTEPLPKKFEPQSSEAGPFRPIEPDEDKGYSRILPQVYRNNLVLEEEVALHLHNFHYNLLGILHTPITHEEEQDKEVIPKHVGLRMEEGNRKRHFWFRFKLCKGTELAELGMALVVDNTSADNGVHCSLIRTETGNGSKWILNRDTTIWPFDPENEFNEEPNDVLLRQILQPNSENEPETSKKFIYGRNYLAVPKVAARFELHDFLIKASAEPMPLEPFTNDKAERIFKACLVVYHLGDGEALWAMEEMERAKYEAKEVESTCRMALLEVMKQIQWETDWDSSDKLEWAQGMDLCETLIDAIRFLKKAEDDGQIPPMTPTAESEDLAVEGNAEAQTPESHETQSTAACSYDSRHADRFDEDLLQANSSTSTEPSLFEDLLQASSSTSTEQSLLH